ncbi:MAG: T9SS type A sorting domain-containing protein [Bacteroidota bacterium]
MKKIYFLIAFVCCAFSLQAQLVHIPADYSTIQAGIEAASPGDTILVDEGIYFENINFKGKAITVASQFILDRDTSHISRTIIDGSQAANPDAASVISFKSGEDSASVITGFTITGGSGTKTSQIFESWPDEVCMSGGGIFFHHSGGKATFNIIEGNTILPPFNVWTFLGCGVMARAGDGQVIVLRNNMIKSNSVLSGSGGAYGGGAALIGGGFLVENNTIQQNSLSTSSVEGGGLFVSLLPYSTQIGLFRNNIITDNKALSSGNEGYGGGISLFSSFESFRAQFQNNIIAGNNVEGYGGGILFKGKGIDLINNTLMSNAAELNGNSLGFYEDASDIVLVNNTLWSDAEDEKRNVFFQGETTSHTGLILCQNILDQALLVGDPASAFDNTYMKPVFEAGSYSQSESSPGIGRGIDSVMIGDRMYIAPALDLSGNPRPHVSDEWIDIGALESSWPLPLFPEAALANIYFGPRAVEPAFQSEVLNYEIGIPDTCTSIAALMLVPVDPLAEVLVEEPVDLSSVLDVERTGTITVHSSDQSTQKSYSVLFQLLSLDATLSSLEESIGKMVPSFDPQVLSYVDTLPFGTTAVPEVTYTTSDENASVVVVPATNLKGFDRKQKITKVTVTAELGAPSITYEIEFVVDPTDPAVTIQGADFTPVVRLYPNPLSTYATLEIRNLDKIKGIQLLNMVGQVVRQIDYAQGETTIIERDGLPAGLYFIRIQSNHNIIKKVLLE